MDEPLDSIEGIAPFDVSPLENILAEFDADSDLSVKLLERLREFLLSTVGHPFGLPPDWDNVGPWQYDDLSEPQVVAYECMITAEAILEAIEDPSCSSIELRDHLGGAVAMGFRLTEMRDWLSGRFSADTRRHQSYQRRGKLRSPLDASEWDLIIKRREQLFSEGLSRRAASIRIAAKLRNGTFDGIDRAVQVAPATVRQK